MRGLLLVTVGCLFAQQQDVTFHAGVSLVHMDVEVTSADGRLVTGLQQSDFKVLDNGKPQPIVHFSSDEEPLDLVLLFDVSGSMRAVVQAVALAAHEGLRELRQGDRVAVMTFNSSSSLLAPFTDNLEKVTETIEHDLIQQRFGGGTHIQTAVDDAAIRLRFLKRDQRRRAVLIVTDNMGVRTRREESVIRDFWEADAILSGVIIHNPRWETVNTVATILGPQRLLTQAGMKGIAEKTGGDTMKSDDPGGAFQQMMHRIRTRYSLYYNLPSDPGTKTRSVRVQLTGDAARQYPQAVVHTRKGYLPSTP
ncbi:MAG TPA: VWA domain-containing protein [Candidatus Sulfopaludibacter sp.]|jgi:VWFA-related protein|nr:VWA domain-containing protein [Candidatus Sulfopaludibacter sp.]